MNLFFYILVELFLLEKLVKDYMLGGVKKGGYFSLIFVFLFLFIKKI